MVALDFEATGLDFARDSVVSYGVVPVSDGRALMAGSQYQEVSPLVPPSGRSITVHELRAADLAGAPPLQEVIGSLRTALDGRFLLTWAAGVEIGFLRTLFGERARRWRRRTVDVMRLTMLLERIAGREARRGDYRLAVAAERFGVPPEGPHHALGDALMTAELFLVLANKLESHRLRTVRQLQRASQRAHPFAPR